MCYPSRMRWASIRRKAEQPAQWAASVVGGALVLLGILGLIPGLTTDYSDLAFAGHGSGAKLFGTFQVSILHDIVHLLVGAVGLALARTTDGARVFLTGGGTALLAFWALGAAGGAGWLPVNTADNWLHFALGLGVLALGFVTGREAPAPADVR
jgi:hypothetical protein